MQYIITSKQLEESEEWIKNSLSKSVQEKMRERGISWYRLSILAEVADARSIKTKNPTLTTICRICRVLDINIFIG